jgi:hypothetical protein
MKFLERLDTGVAHHDQRRINERLQALEHELSTEVNTMNGKPEDYAPAHLREQHARSAMINNANRKGETPAIDNLRQLALLCRDLTYGEMIEFADGIKGEAQAINDWAQTNR